MGSYPGGRRITQECVIGVTTLRDIPHYARDRCDIAITLSQVPVSAPEAPTACCRPVSGSARPPSRSPARRWCCVSQVSLGRTDYTRDRPQVPLLSRSDVGKGLGRRPWAARLVPCCGLLPAVVVVLRPARAKRPHVQRPDARRTSLGEQLDPVAGGLREDLVGDTVRPRPAKTCLYCRDWPRLGAWPGSNPGSKSSTTEPNSEQLNGSCPPTNTGYA